MHDGETTIYSGNLGAYDAAPDAPLDWAVKLTRSADDSRITLHLVDPNGMKQEIAVEIAGDHPQVIAYGEQSDEPLLVAKIGQTEAFVSRNERDPSGMDYVRLDQNGMIPVERAEFGAGNRSSAAPGRN